MADAFMLERTRTPRVRVDLGWAGQRVVTLEAPSRRAGPSKVQYKHQSGSVVVELAISGNMTIYNAYSPTERVIIENADVDDLMVSLDAVLKERTSTGGDLARPPRRVHRKGKPRGYPRNS